MPISQTSSNINIPKGTNPKRTGFGRADAASTGSQNGGGVIQKKK